MCLHYLLDKLLMTWSTRQLFKIMTRSTLRSCQVGQTNEFPFCSLNVIMIRIPKRFHITITPAEQLWTHFRIIKRFIPLLWVNKWNRFLQIYLRRNTNQIRSLNPPTAVEWVWSTSGSVPSGSAEAFRSIQLALSTTSSVQLEQSPCSKSQRYLYEPQRDPSSSERSRQSSLKSQTRFMSTQVPAAHSKRDSSEHDMPGRMEILFMSFTLINFLK